MFKLVLLNGITSKISTSKENLDAHVRSWFSDGYRTSHPGTNTCTGDTDCEPGEVCQSGYCAGLQRSYNIHGTYYRNQYITNYPVNVNDPYHVNVSQRNHHNTNNDYSYV